MSLLAKFVFIGSLLILSACGFTPLYGSVGESSASKALDQIQIAMIPDESGVYLRNALIDRFYQNGYPSAAPYLLTVAPITEFNRDLDITIESEATRRQIKLSTTLSLTDKTSNTIMMTRTVNAVTSYNVVATQFATRISEADAREAALTDLARQIESQLALYFKNKE